MTYVRMDIQAPTVPPSGNLFRVKIDQELNRRDRAIDGNPMVFHFREMTCTITKEWQLYLRAINPGMGLHHVAMIMDNTKAFCNRTGFYGATERQNWIEQEGLNASNPLPAWSKCFTCGDAVVEMIGGIVTLMDGSAPPLLRDGLSHPLTRAQALDPASYKYLPQTHSHLFFAAVNTHTDGTPVPFPNGALYPWYRGGQTPVSFLPHVTDLRDGLVMYPPAQFSGNSAQLVRL